MQDVRHALRGGDLPQTSADTTAVLKSMLRNAYHAHSVAWNLFGNSRLTLGMYQGETML
jgi:hypothetical protein